MNLDTNGLPVQTYLEITSQYWNLIYKNSAHETKAARGKSLNAKDIEEEFDLHIEENNFDFGNSFKHKPVVKERKHNRNKTVTHGKHDRTSVFNEIANSNKVSSQSKFRSFNNKTTVDTKSHDENFSITKFGRQGGSVSINPDGI